MSDLTLLLLLILAGYRLMRFAATDTITARPREYFYDRYPPTLERAKTESVWNATSRTHGYRLRTLPGPSVSRLSTMIACKWCFGVWIAAALVAAVQPWASTPLPLLWWGAVATGISITAQVGG